MDLCLLLTCVFLASCCHVTMGHVIHVRSVPRDNSSMGLMARRGSTTPNIREIVIGRCYEDEQCLQQDQCLNSTLKVTCEELWEIFNASFAYKDPCQAGDETYDQLIDAAQPSAKEDESLFWSGLPSLALNNGRVTRRHTILEETLPGYVFNGLTWCGQLDNPGINYVSSCPSSGPKCSAETMYTFWRAASRAFARQARGHIKVALNGSRTDAFRNSSTFATNELPNLNSTFVSHVSILLVYDISIPGDNRRARCNEGSIHLLQMLLTSYGFSYTCVENPRDFNLLQCASDPTNDHCLFSNPASLTTSSSVVLALMLMLHKWI